MKGYKGWVLPFQVIGLNSITIYMAQRIVDFKGISAFFFGGLAAKMPEALAPVVASTGYLLVSWLFLYFLYKKRIFLKVWPLPCTAKRESLRHFVAGSLFVSK